MAFQEIANLEEKINALIALVVQLRNEKEELINKLKSKEEENARLIEEIERREEERKVLKEKIGSLIEKLSQI
ncbi:cell division protein ZapB [Thermodesulfobacterium hveragerdense]|uniref:cell division protein ZapB n=1 Tax=Thermodesulfobacterium hveragerdense TaxID=53424 RepID=UPI000426A240|nr:cell division protein ZapB [Thermodesulfobacterium hveragerdense]